MLLTLVFIKSELIKLYSENLYMCPSVNSKSIGSCNLKDAIDWEIKGDIHKGSSIHLPHTLDVITLIRKNMIGLDRYDDGINQFFEFKAEGSNMYKIYINNGCVEYVRSADIFELQTCRPKNTQYFSILYRNKDPKNQLRRRIKRHTFTNPIFRHHRHVKKNRHTGK